MITAFFGCVVAFLIAEAILRVPLSSESYLNRIGFDHDVWFRLVWVARHRGGMEIYYSFDRFDPLLGWSVRPDLRDMKVFGDQRLSTNSRGVRGRREFAYERTPGRARVVLLGDSNTFGDEVSDDDTYSAQLQSMMPDVDIINLAVHGFGHDQMLLMLQSEGVKYHPDVVVLGFVDYDVTRNLLSFRDYAKPKFVMKGEGLELTNVPVPPPSWMLQHEFWRLKTIDAVRLFVASHSADVADARARPITLRLFDEIVNVTRRAGATPLFLYLPTGDETNPATDDAVGQEAFMFGYCGRRKIACATARTAFRRQVRDGHVFRPAPFGHWLLDGHHAVAEALRDALVAHGLAARAKM